MRIYNTSKNPQNKETVVTLISRGEQPDFAVLFLEDGLELKPKGEQGKESNQAHFSVKRIRKD